MVNRVKPAAPAGLRIRAGLAGLVLFGLTACGGAQAPRSVERMPEPARSATTGAAAEMTYWAEEYRRAPGDRDIALRYAARLRQWGLLAQAAQVIGEARGTMPTASDLAAEQARIYLEMGKADDALAVLEPLVADPSVPDKDRWPLLNLIGIAHDRSGRPAPADAAYERALAAAPNEPVLLNNYALSLLLRGAPEEAEAVLARVETLEAAQVPDQVAATQELVTRLKDRPQVTATLELITRLKARPTGLLALRPALSAGG